PGPTIARPGAPAGDRSDCAEPGEPNRRVGGSDVGRLALLEHLPARDHQVDLDQDGVAGVARVAVELRLGRARLDALPQLTLALDRRLADELPGTALATAVEDADVGVCLDVAQRLALAALPVGEVLRVEDEHAALEGDVRPAVAGSGRDH